MFLFLFLFSPPPTSLPSSSCVLQGEASWTRPDTAASTASDLSDGAALSARLAITDGGEGTGSVVAGGNGANDWVSYIDEDTEQAYWYNVRTGETSWA
jgi:hypothetical protein